MIIFVHEELLRTYYVIQINDLTSQRRQSSKEFMYQCKEIAMLSILSP